MISVHDAIRRAIVGGLVFSVLSVLGRIVGGRIEKTNPVGVLRSWLAEIGSDLRWLGFGLGATIGLGYAIAPWWGWTFPVAKFFVWFQIILFVALSLVAFVSVSAGFVSRSVQDNPQLNNRDKTNYLTFIPVAASVIKLFVWVFSFVALLAVNGIDITPILNISAVALAIFGFAGQDSLKDILSTIKIFWDRILYVGTVVKYPGQRQGTVTSITLWNTTIRLDGESDAFFIVANRDINKIIILSHPL
ncbi:MAG: mechanosensitive ion channel family protein [Cyanomargarita calcarea GSE-NOS-MK-12-04C]|jgi:small-conductance mechanosensitive channel|uniref:Mechanosensitive ion channel family protein n=1 Tax=Cyanomargarita calcarea GSE-NOS-MK-12-04C TaxID=2839659 RepID=A0A951QL08_9CYAN|nr:mechanosensitive ion channel family protein [Cyanomargarita calcarea GSE-NOS-MK-12-04C]